MSRAVVGVLGLVLALAGSALAQPLDREPEEPTNLPPPPAEPPPPPPPPVKRWTASLAALELLRPAFEVMGEVRLQPRISASLMLGIGKVIDPDGNDHDGGLEVGVQGSYYILQPFRGLHAGAELLYVHVSDDTFNSSLTGGKLGLGGFAGWKWIHRSGFTFIGQGCIQAASLEKAMGGRETRVLLLLHLNAGWSF